MSFGGMIVEVPIGSDGLTGSKNQATMLPSQLLIANGVQWRAGALEKEAGHALYTASPLPGIVLAGHDWWPHAEVQYAIVACSDGTIRKDVSGNGDFEVILLSGVPMQSPIQFVEAGSEAAGRPAKLLLFTGVHLVHSLWGDADTMTPLAQPPADWHDGDQPLTGCVHGGRLWAAGNWSDPHRVYFSTEDDHENFVDPTNAGSLSVFPGEGSRIIGLYSYRGVLLVGKAPRGLYLIDTTGLSIASFAVSRVTRSLGLVSANAMAQVDDDLLFMDPSGQLQSAASVQALGDLSVSTLGRSIELGELLSHVLIRANLPWTRFAYYGRRRELHIALPDLDTQKSCRLVIDYNNPTARVRYVTPESCTALWLRRPNAVEPLQPVRGTVDGQIYLLDQDAMSAPGVTGSIADIATPPLDFGWIDASLAGKNKQGYFIELATELSGPWNIDVEVWWDGRHIDTVHFNLANPQALYDGVIVNLRQRLLGSGRRLQFRLSQRTAGQSFELYRMYVGISILDERPSDVYWS